MRLPIPPTAADLSFPLLSPQAACPPQTQSYAFCSARIRPKKSRRFHLCECIYYIKPYRNVKHVLKCPSPCKSILWRRFRPIVLPLLISPHKKRFRTFLFHASPDLLRIKKAPTVSRRRPCPFAILLLTRCTKRHGWLPSMQPRHCSCR